MLTYITLNVIAIILTPVTVFPFLVPIASNIFGWIPTAFITIIAWTIGSAVAFWLARKYGVDIVKRLIPLKQIAKYENKIPEENIFWTVVFLRTTIPVDILSYALGLFSTIKFKPYILATIIGVSPFAFFFAYAGMLPFAYQVIALLIALIIVTSGLIIQNRLKRKKKHPK